MDSKLYYCLQSKTLSLSALVTSDQVPTITANTAEQDEPY